jgi:enamine deaminase RidA (YjgF/YER057c/UK114 family)
MTTVYERLKALQITLPDVPVPVVAGYDAAFVPFVRTGNLVYLSGRLAKKDGKPWSGKLGEQITTLEGKQAARGIAIELLATLQSALGDLNKIKRIVRLLVMVNGTPNFTEPHVVANGASELFLEILGERGAHARSTFGSAQIPFGACVEIDLIAEVNRPGRRSERRMMEAIRFINSAVRGLGIAAGRPGCWLRLASFRVAGRQAGL